MRAPLLFWCLGASVLGFALMGIDKRRARRDGRRIPERRLFAVALLGGTPGAILGMYAFRHKTRHWYFKWGLPGLLLTQAGILWFCWAYGAEPL